MKIAEIISFLESVAPSTLQESYDNAGLITGNSTWDCSGIIVCLDAIEEVIMEAVEKKCNLVVAHHPIIFSGLKKINGKNYVEKSIITAIKKDIAIYAIHTNLDNVLHGVNGKIALLLGLKNCRTLQSKEATLKKLYSFVPVNFVEQVRNAVFEAGGGCLGNYSECSFNSEGTGTFKPNVGANPFVGEINKRHSENEIRIEVIFPTHLENKILSALKVAHPYEEVAYDIVALKNSDPNIGSGLFGELETSVSEIEFLNLLKSIFNLTVIRHTKLIGKPVKKIAICGGAGSFLISNALAAEVDFFISSDIRYHEFFDANGKMVIADIGHFESEQITIQLLQEVLEQKFPTFAVLKTSINTNPVHYFI